MEALLFNVADARFLTALADLAEVLMPGRLRPAPHAPGFLVGVLNLRGEPLPVVALAERLGQMADADWRGGQRILRVDAVGHPLGVIVDGVAGIRTLEPEQRRTPVLDRPAGSAFLGDLWLIDGLLTQEVHLPDLLAPEELALLQGSRPRLTT